ncbi:hypothetical protein ABMA27_000796 [Loxostege sticticalis]|uniref:THAP-type domain-containing protein n=1 Tax=Loxostege sticticalis TaxID=481309 RepID=A0ABR3I0C6_LOXSC
MISTSLHEKYRNYRYCIVQECKNTSIKTPGKLWITVPSETIIRKTWLRLAQRDPESLLTVTQIYFCEDHFDTCFTLGIVNFMHLVLVAFSKRLLIVNQSSTGSSKERALLTSSKVS